MKSEKGRKGKAGEGEPEPALVPIVSPQEQFKLFEEEAANRRALVKELEAQVKFYPDVLACQTKETQLQTWTIDYLSRSLCFENKGMRVPYDKYDVCRTRMFCSRR